MPTTLARLCHAFGCTHTQPCPTHQPKGQNASASRRASRHERGYGTDWDHFRQVIADELQALDIPPVCGARLPGTPLTQDSNCLKAGILTPARVFDHIIPITGKADPNRLNKHNIQLLCDGVTGRGCHDRKRHRESAR